MIQVFTFGAGSRFGVLAAASLIIGCSWTAHSQQNGPATAPDVRAAEAASLYQQQCAVCHGEALAGGMGPSLTSEAFWAKWQGKPAAALYELILYTMPQATPGSLSEEQATLVTRYILCRNGGLRKDASTMNMPLDKLIIERPGP